MAAIDVDTMRAWVLTEHSKDPSVMKLKTLPKPSIGPNDVLVKNIACAMNPVDTKVRFRNIGEPVTKDGSPRVLGWDGAGIVEAVGENAKGYFNIGDEVYYMGKFTRNGSNAEWTAVDHRQLALKPKNLTFVEAACVPLVGQTTHNAIKEQMKCEPGKTLLIYNGAGGLGSMAIQYAKTRGLKVIATASRPETKAFCIKMGADHVINHREPLEPQLKKVGVENVNYIFNCYNPQQTAKLMPLLCCDGQICNIDPPTIDTFEMAKDQLVPFWLKRCTLVNTFVFSRMEEGYEVHRDAKQLRELTALYEAGKLQSTLQKTFSFEELVEAHRFQGSGKAIGKSAITIMPDQANLKTLKPPAMDVGAVIAGSCTIL